VFSLGHQREKNQTQNLAFVAVVLIKPLLCQSVLRSHHTLQRDRISFLHWD